MAMQISKYTPVDARCVGIQMFLVMVFMLWHMLLIQIMNMYMWFLLLIVMFTCYSVFTVNVPVISHMTL